MKKLSMTLVLALLLVPCQALAKHTDIYSTYTYVLGENDTKAAARTLAYVGLREQLAHGVANYAESDERVRALGFSNAELQRLVPSLIRIEVLNEAFTVQGADEILLTLSAKANVDTDQIWAGLLSFKKDKTLMDSAEQESAQIDKMAENVEQVRETLAAAAPPAAARLAPEQPSPALPAGLSPEEKVVLLEAAAASTGERQPITTLRTGMSYGDMIRKVGLPATRAKCDDKTFYLYSDRWVYFGKGKLRGYITTEDWQGPCHPYLSFMGAIKYF